MADQCSTKVLLERVKIGDDNALNELYARYAPRVLAAVRARLGAELRQKVESWDILQDAFLASIKTVGGLEHLTEGAFVNWLSKIVENRIRDHLDFFRAAKRDHRREVPFGDLSSQASPEPLKSSDAARPLTPSEMLILSEDMARLEKAMDQLSTEDKDLIVAAKIEGLSHRELGESLGKSPDAIRMKVNRAMLALTRAFEQLEATGR